MANALLDQYLPAGLTQDKFAGMKQKKFYDEMAGDRARSNKLMAEDTGSDWPMAARIAYKNHQQSEGTSALPRSAWKAQNISLFE